MEAIPAQGCAIGAAKPDVAPVKEATIIRTEMRWRSQLSFIVILCNIA
jgi:hypothetical protein